VRDARADTSAEATTLTGHIEGVILASEMHSWAEVGRP
jgi:hypothetical protein